MEEWPAFDSSLSGANFIDSPEFAGMVYLNNVVDYANKGAAAPIDALNQI